MHGLQKRRRKKIFHFTGVMGWCVRRFASKGMSEHGNAITDSSRLLWLKLYQHRPQTVWAEIHGLNNCKLCFFRIAYWVISCSWLSCALCVGAWRSLCRNPALSVSGSGALCAPALSGAFCVGFRRSLYWAPALVSGPSALCVGPRPALFVFALDRALCRTMPISVPGLGALCGPRAPNSHPRATATHPVPRRVPPIGAAGLQLRSPQPYIGLFYESRAPRQSTPPEHPAHSCPSKPLRTAGSTPRCLIFGSLFQLYKSNCSVCEYRNNEVLTEPSDAGITILNIKRCGVKLELSALLGSSFWLRNAP